MENNWIFLRGLTRGNVHWGDFPEYFKKINPHANLEFLEIPGNGLLVNEKTPINPNAIVEYLKKNSKLIHRSEAVNLCGISLGGMIALKWAESSPQNIKSVTIINSSLAEFSPFYQRLMPQNYYNLLKAIFVRDPYRKEEIILSITSNMFEKNLNFITIFAKFLMSHQVTMPNFIRQLILANKIKINKKINSHLYVISSINDRLVNHSCSKDIAHELGGEVLEHLTAGHDLPLDDPEWLSRKLLAIGLS